jgi:hypothetical protein
MKASQINTIAVTSEQIDRCTRVIDLETMTPFYMVRSESDDLQEYKVAALHKNGAYYLTCTCPAGLAGLACKHRRWAMAAAEAYKVELKEQAQRDAEQSVRQVLYRELGISYSDVDTDTLKRMARRNAQPAPARQCISGRAFSVLK